MCIYMYIYIYIYRYMLRGDPEALLKIIRVNAKARGEPLVLTLLV